MTHVYIVWTILQVTYGTEDLIKTVHTDPYLEQMKATVNMTVEELRDLSQQYDSVYFNNVSIQPYYQGNILCWLALKLAHVVNDNEYLWKLLFIIRNGWNINVALLWNKMSQQMKGYNPFIFYNA